MPVLMSLGMAWHLPMLLYVTAAVCLAALGAVWRMSCPAIGCGDQM